MKGASWHVTWRRSADGFQEPFRKPLPGGSDELPLRCGFPAPEALARTLQDLAILRFHQRHHDDIEREFMHLR